MSNHAKSNEMMNDKIMFEMILYHANGMVDTTKTVLSENAILY
jgi:hypothetical protein